MGQGACLAVGGGGDYDNDDDVTRQW
jgi:hypothetical protein